MSFPDSISVFIHLMVLIPFAILFLGVVIAVFGKAIGRFPYQPDETKAFTRPPVPRRHLICFLTLGELSPRKKRRF